MVIAHCGNDRVNMGCVIAGVTEKAVEVQSGSKTSRAVKDFSVLSS